jgi:hypothetical protein
MTIDLNSDPRWQRLHDNTWTCPCCGESHGGLFDVALNRPGACTADQPVQPNSDLGSADNILTEDFCVVDGEHFFVRGVLQLPVVGAPGSYFGWGSWSSLSKTNFDIYVETFDSSEQGNEGPWFGWFSNTLPDYPETFGLKCQVYPQANRQRPLIELEPTDHLLSQEQQHGITLDRILELYALTGHDMRDALSA